VISTALAGIRDMRRGSGSLPETDPFEATLNGHPDLVTSLVFLDFSQLLRLRERSGLSESLAYQAIRTDLRKVKAVGAAGTSGAADSTTEITVQIE
jgi:hypothetical protein